MVKKNLLRSLSVVMACMMAVMTVACGSNKATTETTANAQAEVTETEAEKQLENTLAASVHSSNGESGKVETVYVTADANGAVNDVVVSEWLKNAKASSELADTTELKNIVNVKGTESYKENSDGTLTWNAEGSDIYYQGTTDKQLPVDMKITYTLDGKEISPADLAGKSGRVTIRFEYENKDKQTINVDGKDVEVYTPFAMVSGMMLDSDKFSNVEISNGKIISDGGKYIVMGVALPGLKESLDISDEKWEELNEDEDLDKKLSNSFEITADTSDFELGMTITMASSDILSDFGLTDLSDSDKISKLKDDMGELNDGSDKLVDGTKELKDGTTKLRDGSGELYDGTGKLYDGTKDLKDGTGKLHDGTGKLLDGAGQLSDGSGELANGTNTLADGTSKLYDGSKSLYDGVAAYTDGASKINDGASKLATGAASAKKGSEQLKTGVESAQAGAKQLKDGSAQFYSELAKVSEKLSGVSSILAQKEELKNQYAAYDAAYKYLTGQGSSYAECAALLSQLSGGQIDSEEKAAALRNLGLPYITNTTTTTVTKADNGEENEVAAEGGSIDNPENDSQPVEEAATETTDNAVEETSETEVPENTVVEEPVQEETQETENQGENANLEATVENTNDGTVTYSVEEVSGNDMASMLAENKIATTDSSTSEQGITQEQLAAYLNTDEGKNAVMGYILNNSDILSAVLSNDGVKQIILSDENLINSMISDPNVQAKIFSNTDLINSMLSNPSIQAQILGNTDLIASMLNNENVQAQILGNDELIGKLLSNQEVLAKIMGNTELMGNILKNPEVQKLIMSNGELLMNLLSDDETMARLLSNADIMTKIMSNDAVKQAVMSSSDMQTYSGYLASYAQLVGATKAASTALAKVISVIDNLPLDQSSLEKVGQAIAAAKQLSEGNASLADGIDAIYAGTQQLDEGLGQLSTGASTLADGSSKLVENNGKLNDGAKELSEGAGKLNDGANALNEGAGKLYNGAKELKSGADELNTGAGDLDNGAGDLMDGAKELNEGAGKLNDGIIELDDGVVELLDGVCKLDEEGIKKLYEAFDGDLTEFTDKLSAIQEAGSNYTSFAGANADENSSVKFIIKTAGIKAADI